MKPTRLAPVVAAGAAALAAGSALAASPPRGGSIAGPVTSVKGSTFSLKSSLSPTGSSKVSVASSTTISEQVTASRSDLKKGVCAFAVGRKDAKGVVEATRVMLSAPVKGSCGGGFVRRRPPGNGTPAPRPGRGARPPASRSGFAFAGGGITAVTGSSLTVKGRQGSARIALSSATQIVRTAHVTASAVRVGLCAFVQGTSADKGVTVKAQSVDLSKPGPRGCITARRR
jgi:hypothetical protein